MVQRRKQPKLRASCETFYCDRMRERVCCLKCPNLRKCSNHCLNTPDKCGLYIPQEENNHEGAKRKGV